MRQGRLKVRSDRGRVPIPRILKRENHKIKKTEEKGLFDCRNYFLTWNEIKANHLIRWPTIKNDFSQIVSN